MHEYMCACAGAHEAVKERVLNSRVHVSAIEIQIIVAMTSIYGKRELIKTLRDAIQ